MATKEIGYLDRPYNYTKYTIMNFPNWRALEAFAKESVGGGGSTKVNAANDAFKSFVEDILNNPDGGKIASYGLWGKQPRTYKEAMDRDTFLYYDEYKEIKKSVEKSVAERLQKSSEAEAMKPRLVFNDKQIGDFVFDKAAMSLQPEIYHYSPTHKREVDILTEEVVTKNDKMHLSDGSAVVYAFKIEKEDGSIEFLEINGEKSLQEASSKGIVSCTSNNKKVYLYKEKKPKMYNAVKIIVGLTAGGFTSWVNDFYTGVTAGVVAEVLEGLGYAVDVEVVMGGGRCQGCSRKLNFDGNLTHGRRYFSFTAKSFDEQMDTDGLLYTLCDPSFHNIKFISLLNYFFNFFGDQLDTRANPSATWHGIEEADMTNPIGMYYKYLDNKKGNKNLTHFYIHKVKNRAEVIQQITDLVLTCENKNLEALKKFSSHDFGLD
jgi:hypothetical protein